MQGDVTTRFWAKVDRRGLGECWPWTASYFKDRRGKPNYGCFVWEGKARHSSRIAWMLTNGEIPAGLMVMHSCDNPGCCNPAHLSLGTHRDNMAQMTERLRYTHGIAHHSNRLTEDQVRTIRRRLKEGATLRGLGKEYGVTMAAIYFIKTGRTWSWLGRTDT